MTHSKRQQQLNDLTPVLATPGLTAGGMIWFYVTQRVCDCCVCVADVFCVTAMLCGSEPKDYHICAGNIFL